MVERKEKRLKEKRKGPSGNAIILEELGKRKMQCGRMHVQEGSPCTDMDRGEMRV